MSKNINYKNAKRVKLSVNYNNTHLNKWNKYASDMEINNRKVTIDDLVDFGEVLLGEGLTSVNNYLSTVVNYHIDNENMESYLQNAALQDY